MLHIFVTNIVLHTAVTQAEVTLVDAIKVTVFCRQLCFN